MPDLPTLPQSEVDTTYSLPTGTTHNCSTAEEFTTALADSALNDVIVLTAGNTFTGQFTLPNKTSGSGWIYIISSSLGNLPAGTRVAGSGTNMAKIRTTTNNSPCIVTAATAHHFRFAGIELSNEATTQQGSLAQIGDLENNTADLPHHVIFDRCYIHGSDANGLRRGLQFNGDNLAAIECYISNCKEDSDTQTILGFNGRGPIKIHNCYLEAAGENVMFGGADSQITNEFIRDITITRNYFFKPQAWIPLNWTVKNVLELKCAARVLIKGNILENCWADAQEGEAFMITPRNQNGTASWSNVTDVTVQYNKVINCQFLARIAGEDDNNTSQIPTRILFEHNLGLLTILTGVDQRSVGFLVNACGDGGPNHVTLRHNTTICMAGSGRGVLMTDQVADQVDIRDNILDGDPYGIISADGQGSGSAAFDYHTDNGVATSNVFIKEDSSGYPAGNFFPGSYVAVEFVNYTGDENGDYRLDPASDFAAGNASDASDNTDQGADIDAIEAAIAGEDEGGGSATGESIVSFGGARRRVRLT